LSPALLFVLRTRRPPRSPLFPYTTLFRSARGAAGDVGAAHVSAGEHALGAVDQGPVRREAPAVDQEQLHAVGAVVDGAGQPVAAAAVVAVVAAGLAGVGQGDASQQVVVGEAHAVA